MLTEIHSQDNEQTLQKMVKLTENTFASSVNLFKIFHTSSLVYH